MLQQFVGEVRPRPCVLGGRLTPLQRYGDTGYVAVNGQTHVLVPNGVFLSQRKVLIATRCVALIHANGLRRRVSQSVKAQLTLLQLPKGDVRCTGNLQARVNVLQVPAERLAVERTPQGAPLLEAADGRVARPRTCGIVKLLIAIHPDLGSASRVLHVRLGVALGESIRMALAEDVANARAGYNLQPTAALPRPEADLKVLAAPDIHVAIVAAALVEPLAVGDEQTAGNHWRGDGLDWRVARRLLLCCQRIPLEAHAPVKTTL